MLLALRIECQPINHPSSRTYVLVALYEPAMYVPAATHPYGFVLSHIACFKSLRLHYLFSSTHKHPCKHGLTYN